MAMFEKHLSVEGMDFYTVTGTYPAGCWAAFINWGIAAELSSSDTDLKYNTKKISDALRHSPSNGWLPQSEEGQTRIAEALAKAVMELHHGADIDG